MHEDRAKDIANCVLHAPERGCCVSVAEVAQYHLDKVYLMGRIAGLRESIEVLRFTELEKYEGAVALLESFAATLVKESSK